MANVSNPYSFNITNNKSFSGNCTINNKFTLYSATKVYSDETHTGYYKGIYGSISPTTYKGAEIIELKSFHYCYLIDEDGNVDEGDKTRLALSQNITVSGIRVNGKAYNVKSKEVYSNLTEYYLDDEYIFDNATYSIEIY